MFDLKNQLHVRIVCLLASIILLAVGCAPVAPESPSAIVKPFYADYYIVRNLNTSDVRKLEDIAESGGAAGKSAALILGRHEYRKGNRGKAKEIIGSLITDRELPEKMQVFASLWMFDILIDNGDIDGALNYSADLSTKWNAADTTRALQLYCTERNVRLAPTDGYENCYLNRIPEDHPVGKTAPLPEVPLIIQDVPFTDNVSTTDNVSSTPETTEIIPATPPKELQVHISGGSFTDDIVKGVMFAVNENKLPFKLSLGKENPNVTYDAYIYPKKNAFVVNGKTISMNSVMEDQVQELLSLIVLENYDHAVFGVKLNMVEKAQEMKQHLEQHGIETAIVTFESDSFQDLMKQVATPWQEHKTVYVGFGTEEEIIKFVPLAKYYVENTNKQKVIVVTDSLSAKYFTRDFEVYFKDVVIVTDLRFVANEQYDRIDKQFHTFYGTDASKTALLGYDMAKMIYQLSHGQDVLSTQYVTGIVGVSEDRVLRNPGFYKIVSRFSINQLPN